jgi:hypothetical protein
MGFRMRRSIKIAPGIRLNVSKRGVGMSAGIGGARYSVHSSGRRTLSARTGIPGVYYQESRTKRGRSGRVGPPRPPAALPAASKPGLFAPKGERALYKAIRDQLAPEAIAHVGDEFPEYKTLAYGIAGLLMLNRDVEEDPQTVLRMLRTAFDSNDDPAGHPFSKKYLSTYFNLLVAPGVTVHLPFDRDALGLALGEIYQLTGEPSKAIEIVEQLEPTAYSAVSLAELYTQAGRSDEVIALTEGLDNQDDATALLLVFRGVAFREQGFLDAAHESFREAPPCALKGAGHPTSRTLRAGSELSCPGQKWHGPEGLGTYPRGGLGLRGCA